MKRPEDDVHLTDGNSFMVSAGSYKEHLKVAKEIKEVRAQLFKRSFLIEHFLEMVLSLVQRH